MITAVDRSLYLLLLSLILVMGAFLRLSDLGGPSLWHDEIIHLQAAEALAAQPWYRHLTGVREVRGWTENGFAYYALQIAGLRLAPGEIGVRLFPALLGILALALMALCGRRVGGRKVALTSAFLLAVAPLHVYFSREGRPYSLLMLLSLALLLALLERGSRRGIAVAWSACLVAAYSGIHSVPILVAFLALAALGLLREWRRGHANLRSPEVQFVAAALVALGLVFALYLTRSELNRPEIGPSLDTFAQSESHASQLDSPVYQSPLSRTALLRFVASMTTSGHQSVLPVPRSWILIGLALIGSVAGLWRRPQSMVPTAGMFVLPAALSIAALVLVGRWYGLRYTATALPAFLLLVAFGITTLAQGLGELASRVRPAARTGRTATWLAALGLSVALAAPNIAAARSDPYRKLDWRGVARFFDAIALEQEPVLIPNKWSQICLGYYLTELGRQVNFINLWESAETGQAIVDETPSGWLLTAGFRKTNEVRAWMHNFQPVLKKREEELALFFFPDFVTLLETRFTAGRGAIFEEQFEAMGRRFDFSGAESMLQGEGWSYPERNQAGIGYQWATGTEAQLGLPLAIPRGRVRLRIRVLPFNYPEAPPQTVELWLNQTLLAELELAGGWSEHQMEIPIDSWTEAANILHLRFGRSTPAAAVIHGSRDRRSLSVAFDFLEVLTDELVPPA